MPLTKATQNVIEGIVSTGSTGVSAGSFQVGQQYKITSLGTTTQSQWNTIAGTTGQTYVVGSLFTAATIGASSGNGAAAVARTLANRFADVVNVKDFGAVGNGVADDTAAIQAAINHVASIGSGTIVFPHGTFLVTSGFLITTPIKFVGDGNGWYAWVGVTATTGTTIKYNGPMAPDPYVFKFLNIGGGGVGIQDIYIDCNDKANIGVILDGVNGGYFENVSIRIPQNICLTLRGTTHTCSWNTFTNLRLEAFAGSTGALCLEGTHPVSSGNACHNTFINTQINFTGAQHGIYLGGCDNNNFYSTYLWCPTSGVTGYGVYCDPTQDATGLFPINNTFYALQASVRGWYQPSTQVGYNQIFGYQRDNGQPSPITNGTPLTWVTDRGTYVMSPGAGFGKSPGNNFQGTIAIPNGVTSLTVGLASGPEGDANYAIFLSSLGVTFMPQYTIPSVTTTDFTINFSPSTSATSAEYLLIRK